ncbi:oleate hydratase [Companilactobacillus furfuricola]|uniref:oleate hydratase n=1 Tax=Companilactobacillus furfuricola TaxID=1462575 RepID=UPI000F799967|nr:oleate hydratase [Companilactobacillus furfuricola]
MTRKAYMIGTGVGNLAAAIYLIRDGGFKGDQITLMGLETHGANDGAAVASYQNEYSNQALSNTKGFLAKGGRMLNEETFENLWDVLRTVPSLDHPGQTVTDDILNFDHAHPTHDVGRLIDSNGPRVKDGPNNYRHMQFNNKERALMSKLMLMPEKDEQKLNNISIAEWFKSSPHFWKTNFWYMWQTTFAFKRASSVMELRRYMNRMILEFTRINTLEGVTRSPYNQYESIVLPMRKYLKDRGVTFINNRKVTDLEFKDTPLQDDIIVTGIKYEQLDEDNKKGEIKVNDNDLVFDTNGSITDSSSIGDFNTPIKENMEYAPSAMLWKKASEKFYSLGHPDKFFGDRTQSEWFSFTITTNNHLLLDHVSRITQQQPGNALNTWIDSTPLMSLVVHHQPHFHAQKPNETVCWGYFMYPRRNGDFVQKPVIEMTGEEILEEFLGQLAAVDPAKDNIANHHDEIVASVENVIPVYIPYASAMFNQRAVGDRPDVVPKHSKNLAFISQFCEQPFDMVFTEQYSFRAAQIAVYKLLGIPMSELTPMHHYEKDPKIMALAAKTMFR